MALQSAGQITPLIEIASGGTLDIKAARTLLRVQVKTESYQVLESDSGTIFTNYGAGATGFTFTLPTKPTSGLFFIFANAIGQNFTVTSPADKLVANNNATADGLTIASSQIGAAALVFADGNMWYGISLSEAVMTVVSG